MELPTAIDWVALAARLPDGKDPASAAWRRDLFARVDVDGKGFLSFADLVNGLRYEFGCSDELFESTATLMRAFRAAKTTSDSAERSSEYLERREFRLANQERSSEYLEKREFRLLLAYIRQYYELKVGNGRTTKPPLISAVACVTDLRRCHVCCSMRDRSSSLPRL